MNKTWPIYSLKLTRFALKRWQTRREKITKSCSTNLQKQDLLPWQRLVSISIKIQMQCNFNYNCLFSMLSHCPSLLHVSRSGAACMVCCKVESAMSQICLNYSASDTYLFCSCRYIGFKQTIPMLPNASRRKPALSRRLQEGKNTYFKSARGA